MSAQFDQTDSNVIVVIGSGAGGGTLSNELAQKGIDVVCLEAGSRLEFSDIVNDPPLMDERMGWLDKREGSNVWLCKTVGGTTMRWSGVALRFQEYEFKALSTYGKLENTSLIDWPITLEELAPYYSRAEDKMGVSGTHGIPPSAEHNNYKVMKAGGRLAGFKEITSTRMAINPVDRDGRSGCQQIGFCHDGCAIGAKWSTLYTEVPKAEETDHFELRPNSMVIRINHDKAGKVTGVIYVDKNGNKQEQKARAVCVAGNVVETARLLLNSKSNMFPDGLANRADQVGRHYTKHLHGFISAVMPGPVNGYRGARQTGLILDEVYHKPERGFVGGYSIQAAFGPPTGFSGAVGWGEEAVNLMEKYDHVASSFFCGEDPPEATNRIRLHESDLDQHGLPVPVLDYKEHQNTQAMEQHAVKATASIYEALGATKILKSSGNQSTCHNMGVARMSADPEEGVTNRWGQTHDIENLFVSDGSLFSTSGAPNPTLTIVALAIRQAEHIAGRMQRGEL